MKTVCSSKMNANPPVGSYDNREFQRLRIPTEESPVMFTPSLGRMIYVSTIFYVPLGFFSGTRDTRGDPRNPCQFGPIPFPYESRDSYGSGAMGVPLLGVPGISLDSI